MERLSFYTWKEGKNGLFLYGGRFQKQISKKSILISENLRTVYGKLIFSWQESVKSIQSLKTAGKINMLTFEIWKYIRT